MDTFVIRIWRAPADEGGDALRGSLELVGSRLRTPFQNDAELLELLRQVRLEPTSTLTDRLVAGTSSDELS